MGLDIRKVLAKVAKAILRRTEPAPDLYYVMSPNGPVRVTKGQYMHAVKTGQMILTADQLVAGGWVEEKLKEIFPDP